MSQQKTVHVVTVRNWQAEEMQAKGWITKQSLGLDVPPHEPKDAWWMPQASAARINDSLTQHGLPPLQLTSANADLLPSLPKKYLGRSVGVTTVYDAINSFIEWPTLWWKMATAKHDAFMCESLTHAQLIQRIEVLNLPEESILQFSEEIPDILSEYRFFVTKREVKAYSGYLKGDVTVYDGAVFPENEVTLAFKKAVEIVEDREIEFPAAFVMDVAVTRSGVFVLEFNPAWCSGWYDCHMGGVLETIRVSTNPTKKEMKSWAYVPDALFSQKKYLAPLPLG